MSVFIKPTSYVLATYLPALDCLCQLKSGRCNLRILALSLDVFPSQCYRW